MCRAWDANTMCNLIGWYWRYMLTGVSRLYLKIQFTFGSCKEQMCIWNSVCSRKNLVNVVTYVKEPYENQRTLDYGVIKQLSNWRNDSVHNSLEVYRKVVKTKEREDRFIFVVVRCRPNWLLTVSCKVKSWTYLVRAVAVHLRKTKDNCLRIVVVISIV